MKSIYQRLSNHDNYQFVSSVLLFPNIIVFFFKSISEENNWKVKVTVNISIYVY